MQLAVSDSFRVVLARPVGQPDNTNDTWIVRRAVHDAATHSVALNVVSS